MMRLKFISIVIFFTSVAAAQAKLSSDNYFPSANEVGEFEIISSDLSIDDPSRLSQLANGTLISDVGFRKYARRTYSLASRSLSIEVIELMDMKAAYSLLTLLGNSNIQHAPPGDEHSLIADGVQFAQRNFYISIRGRGVSEELVKRIASSVSSRIGPLQTKRPELISHFPKAGYDASTLKYFPGFKAFETYAKDLPAWIKSCGQDMEIAQAKYSVNNQTGELSILSFPTNQMAEACYSKLANHTGTFHIKTTGPLVSVLEGPIDQGSAARLLDSIRYQYSVQWVYEKKEAKPANIFGLPIDIVGKLVTKSLFLVVVIALLSIGAGLMVAVFRFRVRSRMSKNAADNEITHLRMR
jgi:hypothetical protein